MSNIAKQKYCAVCGQPISKGSGLRKYCSRECKPIGEHIVKRKYYHNNKEILYLRRRIRQGKHVGKPDAGYDVLASDVVVAAIQDIRAVTLEEIKRYEDPAYRAKKEGHIPRKGINYLTATAFLLSDRFDSFCKYNGKDIYNMLIREKEDGECKKKGCANGKRKG